MDRVHHKFNSDFHQPHPERVHLGLADVHVGLHRADSEHDDHCELLNAHVQRDDWSIHPDEPDGGHLSNHCSYHLEYSACWVYRCSFRLGERFLPRNGELLCFSHRR